MTAAAQEQSALAPGGPVAATILDLGQVLLWGGALVFTFVMLVLAVALRRSGAGVRSTRWIVGGGVLLPVVVLSALLVLATLRSAELVPPNPPPGALRITLTAHLWWWSVRYVDPLGGADVELANELHLPIGVPVRLTLLSRDVIHSFWVPALAGKVDMVPGRVNHLVLRADRPGVYRALCAEFCGAQHARMALPVVVEPRADFDAWLAAQRAPAAEPSTPAARRGRAAFVAHGCAACHRVRGSVAGQSSADALVLGPDLTHVGSRMQLGAGTLPGGRDAIAQWIAQAQALKPGARMASFDHLGADTVGDLADYLGSLR